MDKDDYYERDDSYEPAICKTLKHGVSASVSNELLCEKHNISLECLAGCSAHRDNWYCSECNKEEITQGQQTLTQDEKDGIGV